MNEDRLEQLEKKVQLSIDVWKIQNTASKHEYYHKGLKHIEELQNIWAQKQPDVSWQNNGGRWVGMDVLMKFYGTDLENNKKNSLEILSRKYPDIENKPENLGMGYLNVHMLTTPVIEVAGDGETAKGIWMSLGDVTSPDEYGDIIAKWAQDMYAIDFIKEDGEWKIWHLTTCVDFYTPFNISWADNKVTFFMDDKKSQGVTRPLYEPTIPGNYYNSYSPRTVAQFLPRIPEPYRTFSETFSY